MILTLFVMYQTIEIGKKCFYRTYFLFLNQLHILGIQIDLTEEYCRNFSQQCFSTEKKKVLMPFQLAPEDMVEGAGTVGCTDVPPHIHKRDTTVAGLPSHGARLRIFLLGPSTLHTGLFDSDGS